MADIGGRGSFRYVNLFLSMRLTLENGETTSLIYNRINELLSTSLFIHDKNHEIEEGRVSQAE
jgi:hypothetical protein